MPPPLLRQKKSEKLIDVLIHFGDHGCQTASPLPVIMTSLVLLNLRCDKEAKYKSMELFLFFH